MARYQSLICKLNLPKLKKATRRDFTGVRGAGIKKGTSTVP